MAKSALRSLFALVLVSQLATALQVTPNSPCSSVCRDSHDLDRSDPGSSTTKSSDITCEDADYSRAAGRKFKKCMSCLETSTFSRGSESDTMWFLYNLRYTAAYCVFGFPDASNFSPTPCTTKTACGDLEASMRHGIPSPDGTTTYSYCSAGDGNAMDPARFESCIACTSALGTTDYLANFFAALSAGCQQKPAPGTLLGLNDTVFADGPIGIVDPETDDDDDSGLATPVIIGIAVGAVVFLLLIAGTTFVCLRRRRNKRVRTSAQGEFRHRHRSSLSFQCQTHLASPRFWPSADEIVSTPMAESPEVVQVQNRSSIWKQQHPDDGYAPHHYYQGDTTFAVTDSAPSINSRKASTLHITTTTTVPPTPPPQAYTPSSSSPSVDYLRSPLSADTVTSTSALLPAFPPSSSTRSSSNSRFSIKPYVPAEHGVHTPADPAAADVVISPVTAAAAAAGVGNGRTPPLWSSAWSLPSRGSGGSAGIGGVPSLLGRRSPRVGSGGFVVDGASGSPVESLEIQTAFAAPPRR